MSRDTAAPDRDRRGLRRGGGCLTGLAGAEELRAHLAAEDLHAPGLIDGEVVSALCGRTLGGHLSATRAHDALTDFEDLPLHRWPAADALRRRAFALRDNVSAYDAACIALAEALDCALVTRDLRLAHTTGAAPTSRSFPLLVGHLF